MTLIPSALPSEAEFRTHRSRRERLGLGDHMTYEANTIPRGFVHDFAEAIRKAYPTEEEWGKSMMKMYRALGIICPPEEDKTSRTSY